MILKPADQLLADLRSLLDSARRAAADPASWKWALLAARSAAVSSMVSVLHTIDGLDVAPAAQGQRWLRAYFLKEGEVPRLELEKAGVLLERFMDEYTMRRHGCDAFRPAAASITAGLRELDAIAGAFSHFDFEGVLIEPEQARACCRSILPIIRHALKVDGAAFGPGQRESAAALLLELERALGGSCLA